MMGELKIIQTMASILKLKHLYGNAPVVLSADWKRTVKTRKAYETRIK